MSSATNQPRDPGSRQLQTAEQAPHFLLYGEREHRDHSRFARPAAAARKSRLRKVRDFLLLRERKLRNLFSLELRPLNEAPRPPALASRPPAPTERPRPGGERRCAG